MATPEAGKPRNTSLFLVAQLKPRRAGGVFFWHVTIGALIPLDSPGELELLPVTFTGGLNCESMGETAGSCNNFRLSI